MPMNYISDVGDKQKKGSLSCLVSYLYFPTSRWLISSGEAHVRGQGLTDTA